MGVYNEGDSIAGTSLESEYDSTFSGDEKVDMLLKLTSDKFSRHSERIKIRQIGFTEPIKRGRKKTMSGLTASVKDLGVVVPIHVMLTEESGLDDEEEDDDFKYIMVDGVRRVFAAMKNGIEEIDAIVWDFKDKDQGMELALVLSLVLNRFQKREWTEVWELYQILEMQTAITPGTLEYLLQLEGGDAMKLKDVVLGDYDEPKEALFNNEKTLDACYKMLQKLRKEEDQLAKEDATGFSDTVEGASEVTSNNTETSDGGQLSDEDVLELLEMVDGVGDDVGGEDFSEINTSSFADEHQKVGERHPVDPVIRQGTFNRDGYKCRCCGTGGVAFLSALVYHHAIPVHCGGADTIENGLTLCDSCHLTLHTTEKNGGKIAMTESQFEEYDEKEQKRIKSIIKYAKIAVEAAKRRGVSQDKLREEANKSARHRMPGENLKENQAGYAMSKSGGSKGGE